MEVTVLSLPACVQCKATVRKMDQQKVAHTYTDMSEDAEAHELAKELGYLKAPVVVVRRDNEIVSHWTGYRPDLIEELASA